MFDNFKAEYKDKINGLLSALYNKRSVLSPSYNMAQMGSALMTPPSARKRSLLNMYAKVREILKIQVLENSIILLFLAIPTEILISKEIAVWGSNFKHLLLALHDEIITKIIWFLIERINHTASGT